MFTLRIIICLITVFMDLCSLPRAGQCSAVTHCSASFTLSPKSHYITPDSGPGALIARIAALFSGGYFLSRFLKLNETVWQAGLFLFSILITCVYLFILWAKLKKQQNHSDDFARQYPGIEQRLVLDLEEYFDRINIRVIDLESEAQSFQTNYPHVPLVLIKAVMKDLLKGKTRTYSIRRLKVISPSLLSRLQTKIAA